MSDLGRAEVLWRKVRSGAEMISGLVVRAYDEVPNVKDSFSFDLTSSSFSFQSCCFRSVERFVWNVGRC